MSTTDPASSSSANTDHTKTNGEKPDSALGALLDPTFHPSLKSAPLLQKAKSYALLLVLVFGAVFSAWLLGFDMLQVSAATSWVELGLKLGGVGGVVLGLLAWTGTTEVDLWSLVMEWGWYSIPVAGFAGLMLVMMMERTEALREVE